MHYSDCKLNQNITTMIQNKLPMNTDYKNKLMQAPHVHGLNKPNQITISINVVIYPVSSWTSAFTFKQHIQSGSVY